MMRPGLPPDLRLAPRDSGSPWSIDLGAIAALVGHARQLVVSRACVEVGLRRYAVGAILAGASLHQVSLATGVAVSTIGAWVDLGVYEVDGPTCVFGERGRTLCGLSIRQIVQANGWLTLDASEVGLCPVCDAASADPW